MKIWLGKPRSNWYSPYLVLDKLSFVKDKDKWADRLEFVSLALQKVLDKVRPQVSVIKVDYWDTWSMDRTMSPIIHKLLVQLHKTKHGAPLVDDADVPMELRSTAAEPKANEWDVDSNHFKRWDWVMDEMIWAFAELSKPDYTDPFYTHKAGNGVDGIEIDRAGLEAHQQRIDNGLRLFGKYYQALWD
jgi:hypothetical protein